MENSPFSSQTQLLQLYSKYSRWDEEKKKRENWQEVVTRTVDFFKKGVIQKYGNLVLSETTWKLLEKNCYELNALPSMRSLQMSGKAAERCNVCIYNCAALGIIDLFSFSELLYILMQGTGCSFSVEREFVSKLPVIQYQKPDGLQPIFVVEDSTEGWCNALHKGITTWFNGEDVIYDFSKIRKEGAILRTKGGRASGAKPLKELLEFVRKIILENQGKKLTSLICHDICCFISRIVELGGVRRSAMLSHSDLDDKEMKMAKWGTEWQTKEYQRWQANNSVSYRKKPTYEQFCDEWESLRTSGSGERGIFNGLPILPFRRIKLNQFYLWWLTNPCGEIILRMFEFCNLSIAVARKGDTLQKLIEKVRLATIWGTIQSLFTDFKYIRPEWKQNCDEERLLGVDIINQMGCELIQPKSPQKKEVLSILKEVAVSTNKWLAERFGINQSVAVTCIKPAGNSSEFLNVSTKPYHSEYFIRRFSLGKNDPIAKLLVSQGMTGNFEKKRNVWLFEFPMKAPDGAITVNGITALEQFENWLDWKKYYTEHNPSVSIYVKDDEWDILREKIWENWEFVGGLSFFPYSENVYENPPFETITKEEYERRLQYVPNIDWERLKDFETEDNTTSSREYACVSGECKT